MCCGLAEPYIKEPCIAEYADSYAMVSRESATCVPNWAEQYVQKTCADVLRLLSSGKAGSG